MIEFAKDEQRRLFSGWGTISIVDRQNDYIDVLKEFRDAGVMEKMMKRGAPVIDSHSNHVVGKIISYEYKMAPSGNPGLYLTAEIHKDYPSDDDTWEKIKEGAYAGFSLGGKAQDKTPVCTIDGCHNNLTGIESWEWSIVETPANQEALIDNVNKLAKSLKFSKDDAKKIGDKLNVNWDKIKIDEFQIGLNIELEHGTKNPETNITNDNEEMTAKIALAHLLEFPDYYSKSRGLPKMEDTLKKENPILKYVRQCGDKWCVYSESGKRLGSHPSKEDANQQLYAIEVNKAKVYVKNPSDVPQGVKLQEGKRGGKYYESSQQPKSSEVKTPIKTTSLNIYNKVFETGKEVTIPYLHNTQKSPNLGSRFGQDIEPSGKYVIYEEPGSVVLPGWEKSEVTLHNPLVIEWKDWKKQLFETYNKNGKQLSEELQSQGYDGVVTIDGKNLSEIVLLKQLEKPIQKARVYVKNPSDAPQGVKLEEGERGGHYYESSGITENVNEDELRNSKITFNTLGFRTSLELGTPLVAGERIPEGHIGKIDVESLPDQNGYVELIGIRIEDKYRGKGLGEFLLKNILHKLKSKGISGIKSIKYSTYENEEGRSENATRMFERILNDKDNEIQVTKDGDDYYLKLKSEITSREVKEVDPHEFEQVKSQVPQNMKHFLSTYTPEQMKQKGIKTYLTPNKTAGVALNGDEIINLFSLKNGEGKKALIEAIKNGGRRLDCFDKRPGEDYGLPDYYSKFGFKEVKREKNWQVGEPDVVYMSL